MCADGRDRPRSMAPPLGKSTLIESASAGAEVTGLPLPTARQFVSPRDAALDLLHRIAAAGHGLAAFLRQRLFGVESMTLSNTEKVAGTARESCDRAPLAITQPSRIWEGGGRSVGGARDVQELLVETGTGEQCGSGVGPVLAGEVAEGAAGLLDDGYQRGNVPGTGSQEEEGIQLTGCDEEGAVTGAGSDGRFAGSGAAGSAAVQSSSGRTCETPPASFAATMRSCWFSLDGGGQMPTAAL